MSTRITGGEWRGRTILTPPGDETRPSASFLREGLFNILGQQCSGWRVADLYAGSGSVGFEALSRGAASAIFVDNHPPAIAALKTNVERLASRGATVVKADVMQWIHQPQQQHSFDLLFIDPPFTAPFPETVNWLSLLAPNGFLVVQHPSTAPRSWPTAPDRTVRYGASSLSFWRNSSGLTAAQ